MSAGQGLKVADAASALRHHASDEHLPMVSARMAATVAQR
jgi:hypothetical protein